MVPLEYGRTARSFAASISTSGAESGSPSSSVTGRAPSASPTTKTSSTPAAAAASVATSRNGGTVSSIRAPESRSWCSSSRAVYSGFAVVARPPARAAPWKAIAYSGRFGM